MFDVKNAAVAVLPKPTMTKTYQAGSVWQVATACTLDFDVFRTNFDNDVLVDDRTRLANRCTSRRARSTTKGVEVGSERAASAAA